MKTKKYYNGKCIDCGIDCFGKRCKRCHPKTIKGHPFYGDPKTQFQKGHVPKNKNKGIGWIEKGYRAIMKNGKVIREHRVIWEECYGKIPKGHQIHHINGKRSDNRIENLQMIHIGEHTKLHNNGFQKGNKSYKKRKHNQNGVKGKWTTF